MMAKKRVENLEFRMLMRPRLACASGFSVSIQANSATYCSPRDDTGPYVKVEAGFPSSKVEEWLPWAETPSSPTGSVYGFLPLLAAASAVFREGGRVSVADEGASLMSSRLSRDDLSGLMAWNRPSEAAPKRLPPEVWSDKDKMFDAAWGWAAAAVLGPLAEERSSRFVLAGENGKPLIGWAEASSILFGAFPREKRDLEASVCSLVETAGIYSVSPPRSRSPRRRSRAAP